MRRQRWQRLVRGKGIEMPELPEVQTVVSFLDANVIGERIESIEVLREKNILSPIDDFLSLLKGSTFESVTRKGKFILFHLDNGHFLLSHLRMEGKYYLYQGKENDGKHDILRFRLASGRTLSYNDVRKFGTLYLRSEKDGFSQPPLSELGEDALEISVDNLYGQICQSKHLIKSLLMDQTIVAGIGNIYADEALFDAKVSPRSKGEDLTFDQVASIVDNNKRIMLEAIEEGGSTIRSYHPSLGMDGRMQNRLLAYGNQGGCPNCGLPMRRIFLSGRSAHFCPSCQKGKRPIVIAVTGPIHSGKSTVSKYLNNKGFALFDCDIAAKTLYLDKIVIGELRQNGIRVPKKNGEIDFTSLRKTLANEKKRKIATSILYPHLREKAISFIEEHRNDRFVIFEIPLYKGSGLEDLVDYLVLVDADIAAREDRLINEGKDAETLLAINSKYPLTAVKKEASYTIVNNGSLEELLAKADSLPILR